MHFFAFTYSFPIPCPEKSLDGPLSKRNPRVKAITRGKERQPGVTETGWQPNQ